MPLAGLEALAEKKLIPLYSMFELTYACNLKCSHCYIRKSGGRRELNYSMVMTTLSSLAGEGNLFITFTGGEIFIRKDIFKIFEYSAKSGFAASFYSNGTLLGKEEIKRLKDVPMREAGISIYSGRSEVHDGITGVKGSFLKAIKAAELLVSAGIRTKIKCPLMKQNIKDAAEVAKLAGKIGANYQFDPLISAANDGDKRTLSLRLNEEELIGTLKNRKISGRPVYSSRFPERNLLCSAGKNFVSINPYGDVFPCLQFLVKAGNIRENTFRDIWKNSPELKKIRKINMKDLAECRSCRLMKFCNRCAGLAGIEDGNIKGASSAACFTAAARARERLR